MNTWEPWNRRRSAAEPLD